MRERVYLTGSVRLTADPENRDPEKPDIFTIRQVVGEGGSSVCYEAVKNGQMTGKLKEYYPVDAAGSRQPRYFNLIRKDDGQLVPGAGSIRSFAACCEQYIEKYRILERKIKENPKNEILKNYIQLGEVYYGCGRADAEESAAERTDAGRPTVYLWCRGQAGIGMDQYFADIKRNESMDAAEKMRNILEAVSAVADCVRAMHTAGIMHLDIKPANFFVECNSEGEIEPDKLSLFDINTICERPADAANVLGTPGFSAPEVRSGRGEYRSDFYSIGALLFQAVMDSEGHTERFYRDSDYRDLEALIGSSKLISGSGTNADIGFRSILNHILRRCLHRNPGQRYESCSDLKKDLTEARRRWTRVEFNRRKSVRMEIAEPEVVIQKLLYDYPLYSAFDSGQDQKRTEGDPPRDLNVLVIGQDPYGRKFMDVCLEIGQMYGVRLAITAASQNPEEEKALCLKDRPAFTQFVQVDEELPFYKENNYGIVRFTGTEGIYAASGLKKYHYIFIALDEDGVCQRVAWEIAGKLKSAGQRCVVCYLQREDTQEELREDSQEFLREDTQKDLCEGTQKVLREDTQRNDDCRRENALREKRSGGRTGAAVRKPVPVCVNRPVTFRSIDDNIGEMAFHTHAVWSGRVNMDLTKERKKFFEGAEKTDRYNRIASLHYAVSIKYKLHSIDIRESEPKTAAAQFAEQVLARKDCEEGARRKFNRLVALEHRRWVMEKVMDGWTAPPRDKNSGALMLKDAIARAAVKDMERKIHPCLVPGTEETPLESPSFSRERWDSGDISGLDELDRMSVELHRCFRREANLIRRENFPEGGNLYEIRSILPPNEPALMRAFTGFQETLKGILKGSESSSRQYDAAESALLAACDRLPESSRRIVTQRLNALRHDMFPVIESNLYRNYKKYDEDLIEKIPFILTWRSNPSLVMPLEDGSGGAIVSNVAAATVLIPGDITYLYFCRDAGQMERALTLLGRISDWYFAKNISCGVHLVAAIRRDVDEEERACFSEKLRNLQETTAARGKAGRFEGMDAAFDADDTAEAGKRFAEYLAENREYLDLFDVGESGMTESEIPYFQYEWKTGRFPVCEGCEYLRYLESDVRLRAEDLCALLGGTWNGAQQPEFAEDYETLWEIYSGGVSFEDAAAAWRRMARALRDYDRGHRTVAVLRPGNLRSGESSNVTHILPEYCFTTARKLLDKLVRCGIAGENSRLSAYTSETCRLSLTCAAEHRKALDKVFSEPQRLLPFYNMDLVEVTSSDENRLEIRCDDLTVRHLKTGEHEFQATVEILRQLEKAGFLQGLSADETEKEVSFRYLSPRIKWLLTTEGAMLKVYAFYEALKTGYFDTVSLGSRIEWGKISKPEEELRKSGNGSSERGEASRRTGNGDCEPYRGKTDVISDFVLTKGFRSLWIRSGEESADMGHVFAETFGETATVVLLKESEQTDEESVTEKKAGYPDIRVIAGKKHLEQIGEKLMDAIRIES